MSQGSSAPSSWDDLMDDLMELVGRGTADIIAMKAEMKAAPARARRAQPPAPPPPPPLAPPSPFDGDDLEPDRPGELVVFDAERWRREVVPGPSAEHCLKRRTWGRGRSGAAEFPLPCGTLTCLTGRCAVTYAWRHLRHLEAMLGLDTPHAAPASVWALHTSPAQSTQLRQALSRLRKNERAAWYVVVRRGDGTHSLMSHPIAGQLARLLTELEPAAAFDHARTTMYALPGFSGQKPVTWSPGSAPSPAPPSGFVSYFNTTDPARLDQVKRYANRLARDRHGIDFDALAPDDMDVIGSVAGAWGALLTD